MDYDDPETARRLKSDVRAFMDESVIPAERELDPAEEDVTQTVNELRQEAKEQNLFAPQVSTEYGGQGYDFRDVLPAFEEAGRSLLGPQALRVDAPDEGNMHTLELAASQEQKDRWLKPLVKGEFSSAFAMTEPSPGGGSDPKMLRTTALAEGEDWVINGHKWWTTNGLNADFFIVMARTDLDNHPYEGTSLILVPAETEGITVKRDIPHLGPEFGPGHAEILFEDVRVPQENLLGEENAGFLLAQRRLGPARLTHCMRFCGMADRAVEVAKAYMSDRSAFGSKLSEKQSLQFGLADAKTNLHAARTMIRHAADAIANGEDARREVAMCKNFAANKTQEIIDWALQACGGSGIGKDLPIASFYELVRMFRIVDGPDEVHRRTIAREELKDIDPEEVSPLPDFEVETALTE
ncbi:MAG: acyl-CoA dehydrogenase family protein [bacterium]